ncbi:MAG: hypothetical protein IPM35_27780 [Myxococcales bacterium]|nr:hypothetical protein [Myxococcales bacterium]
MANAERSHAMGWWKVEGTSDVVGDDVLSLLRTAALEVNSSYFNAFGRSPTRSEWERLMCEAVEPVEDLETDRKEFVIAEGSRPSRVKIVLDGE